MKTASNIVYERIIQDEPEDQASFLVEWDIRYAFCDEIMGASRLPSEHPDKPGMYAASITFRGLGPFNRETKRFPYAIVTVEYAAPSWDCQL